MPVSASGKCPAEAEKGQDPGGQSLVMEDVDPPPYSLLGLALQQEAMSSSSMGRWNGIFIFQ